MLSVALVIGVGILAFMFYEDFRHRGIQWWLFVLLGIFAVAYQFLRMNSLDFVYSIPLSISIALLLLTTVLAAYWLKSKKPIFQAFGLGDVLFILAITPLFSTLEFVMFLSISFIAAGILHLLFQLIKPSNTVPLAGYQSLALAAYLIVDFAYPNSFFQSLNQIAIL